MFEFIMGVTERRKKKDKLLFLVKTPRKQNKQHLTELNFHLSLK